MRTVIFLAISCLGVAFAQIPPALVVNTGVATVTEAPSIIEVLVEHKYQDHDLVVALAQAGNFESRLRETLNNNKLYPTEVEAVPPYVSSLPDGEVTASVRLQFVLPRLGNTIDRVTQTTQLRRTLNNMAETMQFQYTEPVWTVDNPQLMEKEAVDLATENAYFLAEAAANSLDNNIDRVDSIEILGVEWNITEGHPNMNAVSCTAKVKVVYVLFPTN